MQIPEDILEKWKKIRSSADSKQFIADNPGIDKQHFTRAFRYGKCNDDVFKAMTAFYVKKSKDIIKTLKSK